ncbi:MAG: hypothetical protein ACD_48C00464G0001 [uncultured bacterium]|nr:MAG: hypothetical protein ACD_48C00464G0001 [uncultured bacterium]
MMSESTDLLNIINPPFIQSRRIGFSVNRVTLLSPFVVIMPYLDRGCTPVIVTDMPCFLWNETRSLMAISATPSPYVTMKWLSVLGIYASHLLIRSPGNVSSPVSTNVILNESIVVRDDRWNVVLCVCVSRVKSDVNAF